MRVRTLKYTLSTILILALYAGYLLLPLSSAEMTTDRTKHILYGDETGGGHLYGTGKPCKSEFPKDWSEQKIIRVATEIAANDNAPWRREKNGYYVTEVLEEGIKVRVVLGPSKHRIITAYPTNRPRNPCPAANDN